MISDDPSVKGPIVYLRRRWELKNFGHCLLASLSLKNERALVDVAILVDEFVAVFFHGIPFDECQQQADPSERLRKPTIRHIVHQS